MVESTALAAGATGDSCAVLEAPRAKPSVSVPAQRARVAVGATSVGGRSLMRCLPRLREAPNHAVTLLKLSLVTRACSESNNENGNALADVSA